MKAFSGKGLLRGLPLLLLLFLLQPAGAEDTQRIALKVPLTEENLRDNMALYADQDDPSVITMYLTVTKGNAADGSDHTWPEINTYSVSDYEKMGVPRYMAEGILQIDETGEGILTKPLRSISMRRTCATG